MHLAAGLLRSFSKMLSGKSVSTGQENSFCHLSDWAENIDLLAGIDSASRKGDFIFEFYRNAMDSVAGPPVGTTGRAEVQAQNQYSTPGHRQQLNDAGLALGELAVVLNG